VPGGPSAGAAAGQSDLLTGTICWAGCLDGLTEEGLPVAWSADHPGDFTMQFAVPQAPWLAANGPRPLSPGEYQVGVQCVGPNLEGCALKSAEASATFSLHGPTSNRCLNGPCATLQLTPAQAAPGTLVQARGWAPLVQIIGQPFGYSLVLEGQGVDSFQVGSVDQTLDGSLTASFRVPLSVPGVGVLPAGAYTVALQALRDQAPQPGTPPAAGATIIRGGGGTVQLILAPTALSLAAPPAWSSLGVAGPLLVQRSSDLEQPSFGVDPSQPQRLAYCAPGAIRLSSDRGATWTAIDTRGVIAATAGTPYILGDVGGAFPPGGTTSPVCHAITLDPQHPDSFYATFEAAQKQYGAPPIFYLGYVTTNRGKSWQVVPVPPGHELGEFGGFRVGPKAVQALFANTFQPALSDAMVTPTPAPAVPFAVVQTRDGGQSWAAAQLACPAPGPCITWGTAPNGIGSCDMHGYEQPIELSADGGRSWVQLGWPDGANACETNELATLGPKRIALLSGRADYPVRISDDGGRTWQAVGLPPLPDSNGDAFFPGLQILPDGTLLVQQLANGGWYLLAPGASNWCALAGSGLPSAAAMAVQPIGDRLWWQESGSAPGAVTPKNLPLADLRCR
jgi:hypothetical protein